MVRSTSWRSVACRLEASPGSLFSPCRFEASGNEPPVPPRHGQNEQVIALTRKNALFAGSEIGAENWAMLASLVATCKLLGVNSVDYLADTLGAILDGHPRSRITDLMLWCYAQTSSLAV